MPLSGSGPLFPCPVLLGRSEDRSFAAIAAVSAQQPSPAHSSSVAIPISGGFSAGAREASSSSSACLNCAQVNWCFLQHSTAVLGVHICTPAHPRSSCTGATLESFRSRGLKKLNWAGCAMGLAKKAVADASITFLWVFAMASLGAVSTAIAPSLGLDGPGMGKVYVIFALVSFLIFFFSFLGQALGGASWNPTALVAFSYAGVSDDDLFTLGVRLPAQMAGAVGGALAILEVMPKKYKHMVGGPKLKVPLQTGVVAEAVLTFAITLIVMWALLRGPRNPIVKTFIIIGATISLVIAGGAYTGPAMNPANAFGWAFVSNQHTSWEHFAVYWAGPMIGTICAVWAFNLLFGSHQAHKKAAAAKKSKAKKPAPKNKSGSEGEAATKSKKLETESSTDKVKAS